MTATPLTASEVQALYPSSAAQNQRDYNLAKAQGSATKPIRREIAPGRVAETKA